MDWSAWKEDRSARLFTFSDSAFSFLFSALCTKWYRVSRGNWSWFWDCFVMLDFLLFMSLIKKVKVKVAHTRLPSVWFRSWSRFLAVSLCLTHTHTHTQTHPFNGPLSETTQVSRYQKGKTNLDFTGARDSERQWYQLGHMQVCTSLQTDNHASTSLLKFFYRPDALPATQPTVSKHWRQTCVWR